MSEHIEVELGVAVEADHESAPKLEELVKTYLTIRDAKSKLYNEYQTKSGQLEEELNQIEAVLLDECGKIGADSIRTNVGTVTRTVKEEYTCSNWDEFKQFILQENALELLAQKIHQSNFKEFMANHDGEGLPPGISSFRAFKATVRKTTAK
jgi:hypothetical protein